MRGKRGGMGDKTNCGSGNHRGKCQRGEVQCSNEGEWSSNGKGAGYDQRVVKR